MHAILTGVLPIFALILIGFAAGRGGHLGDGGAVGINRFVYYVAIPPLMFRLVAELGPQHFAEVGFIATYLTGELAVFALAALVACVAYRRRLAEQAVAGISATFSNGIFLALPLALALKGEAGAAPALVIIAVDSAFLFPFTLLLVEVGLGAAGGLRHGLAATARSLIRNPMLLAVAAGALWGWTERALPGPVDATVRLVGGAAAPCALFALGATLSRQSRASVGSEIGLLIGLKLAVQPLLVWWLANRLFQVPPDWAELAVLIAALPTGATAYVVARQYDVGVDRAAAAVLVSTAVSVVTVSALVLTMQP